MRLLALLVLVAVLAVPAVAAGQDEGGGEAFGPLPAAPTPNPQPVSVPEQDDGSGERTTLYVIGGGLLLTFVVIGRVIMRDARRHTPATERDDGHRLREEGPHRHAKHAKARARARGKAQRAARRRNR